MDEEKQGGMLAKAEEETEGLRKKGTGRLGALGGKMRQSFRDVVGGLTSTERLIIIFAVGIVLGYGVKLAVRDTVTIGYDDYTLRSQERSYDLLEMEKRLSEAQMTEQTESSDGTSESAVAPTGSTCQ